MIGICAFCGRENVELTEHHLIPRTTHSKKKIKRMSRDLNETVGACRPCHSHIHATFSEKELAETYNTVTLLMAHEEICKFSEWVKDKPNELRLHNKRSNRRKRR